jgi:predicted N-acetyltransferase YhbS
MRIRAEEPSDVQAIFTLHFHAFGEREEESFERIRTYQGELQYPKAFFDN